MSDQKNKQQQPQQGNEKNQSKSGMPQGGEQQGNQQRSGQPQGSKQQPQGSKQQPQGSQQSNSQTSHKGNMADTNREQPIGSDIENPDRDNDPDKKVSIDDDPEQTRKKVPNMGK
jgi:hypothetical protein